MSFELVDLNIIDIVIGIFWYCVSLLKLIKNDKVGLVFQLLFIIYKYTVVFYTSTKWFSFMITIKS